VRQKRVPWERSQHARALAAEWPVSLATTARGEPIIAANGLQGSETTGHSPSGRARHPPPKGPIPFLLTLRWRGGADEEAKDGMRRRGAEGKGAAAALTELSAFRMGFLPSALGAGLQVRAIGLSP
jgi:hypothetical protein